MRLVQSQPRGAPLIFGFSEDMGPSSSSGSPSPWQLPDLRTWAYESGMMRMAINQCEITHCPTRRPLGLLSDTGLSSRLMRRGWPRFAPQDGSYQGPLESTCRCGRVHETWSTLRARRPSIQAGPLEPHAFVWLVRQALGVRSRPAPLPPGWGLLRQDKTDKADDIIDGKAPETAASSDSGTWTPPSTPSFENVQDQAWDHDLARAFGNDVLDDSHVESVRSKDGWGGKKCWRDCLREREREID